MGFILDYYIICIVEEKSENHISTNSKLAMRQETTITYYLKIIIQLYSESNRSEIFY